MEKILDRDKRDMALEGLLLLPNQHAYQSRKSYKSALHALVNKIEQAILYKEIDLAVFLDIDGGYDNI